MYDDIRPYNDEEIPAAMQRIADSTSFPLLASYVYPKENIEKVRQQIRSYTNVHDFQVEVMRCVNEQVIARSIGEFTYGGMEQLSPSEKYLFVSNHRDIMLDACLLQYVLYMNGHEPSQITFGANLMQGQLVTDIGKANKMFKVERPQGNNPREFYQASLRLSQYMRYVLTERRESIWIAQRNGRTKDGIDRTDQGIIKMFGMGYNGDKVDALEALHIVPIAISYEWESCDVLKTLELYASRSAKYIKKPGEDLTSILTGIMQPKGRVHIEVCKPIGRDELEALSGCMLNEYNRKVASLIDSRITAAYRLTPNNYIAHDLRYGKREYEGRCYDEAQRQAFVNRMDGLKKYGEQCDMDVLLGIFLGIYSNPIDSKK